MHSTLYRPITYVVKGQMMSSYSSITYTQVFNSNFDNEGRFHCKVQCIDGLHIPPGLMLESGFGNLTLAFCLVGHQ